jgi:hypothetical protein
MLDHEGPNPIQLMGPETMGFGKTDWIKPEFGDVVAVLDVYMRWLRSFKTIEEETEAGNAQDSRHRSIPA